jgi:hypothetical protein
MPQGIYPDQPPPPNAPDLVQFKDAQMRLNQALGQLVTFLVPNEPVWPPGTVLDPETNLPYDPTVVPTSDGEQEPIEIRVVIVYRPIQTGDDVTETASGVRMDETIALIIQEADYADVSAATQFILDDVTYRISEFAADNHFNGRYIAFGEAQ